MISIRAKVTSDKPAYTKKEKSDSGGTIYRYTPEHLKKRWKEKKDKLKKLEKDIGKVREQYKKDLKSDDERERAIAAVVGIMDCTSMRIGNPDSASEGTFGASTLKVKHVKDSGGKMKFNFPGKGAIEQNVELKDAAVRKVIKDLMKGKKKDDFIFEVDGKKIWDRAVNRYLQPFGISAKDIRGFHANRLMKETLKKKDFKDALEEVADIVGHKASTLKNQYLDPELVSKHEKSKKASLSKSAISAPTSNYLDELEQKYFGAKPQKPTLQQIGIGSGVKLNQLLLNAWKTLKVFLPKGAEMTSGARTQEDQVKIIKKYWLKATGQKLPNWPVTDPRWVNAARILTKQYGYVVASPVISGEDVHMRGRALDVSGADLNAIARTAKWVSNNPSIPVTFSQVLIEPRNNAVHIGVKEAEWDPDVLRKLIASVHTEIRKNALSLDEIGEQMGFGVPDEPGDWFEKSPMFRYREEAPRYEVHDKDRSDAKKMADEDPEKFFYKGLHKEFPDLEAPALKNMLKNNAKFYFVFKYHERDEDEIKDLLLPAAENLCQQDARAFFYYNLHHEFPELGRGAIVQLIDTNPDSFFELGLQKDYPDFEESANNARNIKDPQKVELEIPEWLSKNKTQPLSLRERL